MTGVKFKLFVHPFPAITQFKHGHICIIFYVYVYIKVNGYAPTNIHVCCACHTHQLSAWEKQDKALAKLKVKEGNQGWGLTGGDSFSEQCSSVILERGFLRMESSVAVGSDFILNVWVLKWKVTPQQVHSEHCWCKNHTLIWPQQWYFWALSSPVFIILAPWQRNKFIFIPISVIGSRESGRQ